MRKPPITASPGMYLTNGIVYGKAIYLAEDMNESDFYEVTEEEYNKVLEAEEKEALSAEI